MRKIIAIDVDDVLGSQNEAMMRFANKKYGLKHTIEDYTVEGPYWGYWENVWGVTPEEGERRVQEYHDSGGLDTHEPLFQAIEAIKQLQKKFDLVVITARQDTYKEQTHAWLEKHFSAAFKDVHFLAIWNDGPKETKAEVCKRMGAAYLIDDNADHCRLASEVGVQALLFGVYGWNKAVNDLPSGVVRVKDWGEVLEYFEHEI